MARQFDIVENLNPARRGQYPLLLILQHDRTSSVGSVVVTPLVDASSIDGTTRLNPLIEVDGRSYKALIAELAAIPRQSLGRIV